MKIKTSFEEEHSPKYYGVQKIKYFQTFSLDLDNIIFTTFSNDSGFYQIAIPGESKFSENLKIVAGDNFIFKPFTQKLSFHDSRKLKINLSHRPSQISRDNYYKIVECYEKYGKTIK